jgi:hypothetical protein
VFFKASASVWLKIAPSEDHVVHQQQHPWENGLWRSVEEVVLDAVCEVPQPHMRLS